MGVRAGLSALAGLMGTCDRIAVVDVETTGLYHSDRIVEIAIVTIDPAGKVVEEFETLIQPMRDVGPTWLHGIHARMLREAPTFADVAQHVAARVNAAVVAAHNLPFDTRMVGNELTKAGIHIDWGSGLDTLGATGCKLGQACAKHRIRLGSAHRAIADARATAKLLVAVADSFSRTCVPAVARPLYVTPMRVCRRDGHAQAAPPYLAALAQDVQTSRDVAPYAALLGIAIADLRFTDGERCELRALAADFGMDDQAVARAHREFLNGLIDAAVEDQVVTKAELEKLCRAAALLDVDVEHVARRTDPFRAIAETLHLEPGMSVCFTGLGYLDNGEVIKREGQIEMAKARGFVVVNSVTNTGPDLVVAGDVESRSAKARNARQLGVPICAFNDFAHAVNHSQTAALLAVKRSTPAPRQPAKQLTPPRWSQVAASEATHGDLETLICFDCGARWQRPRSRGRRPGQCPDCRAKG